MIPLASLTTERDWPWRDGDLLGWPGLVAAALVLVVLTLWTYAGQRQVGWRKVLAVLGLRLGALAVIVLLLLKPSFASEQKAATPGRLIIIVDSSLSMKINDAPNGSARWEFARKLLEWPAVKEALQRLQTDRQVDIVFYQAAESVRKYDPAGDADGKRTDIGEWLYWMWKNHHEDANLRGLILLTDGADNGTSRAVLDEAAKLREMGCPIYPFGIGSEATRTGQKDIAVVDVKAGDGKTGKKEVYVKSTVPVWATTDAPGLEGQNVTVHLFIDDKEVGVGKNVALPNSRGNLVEVGQFVPERAGEVKVTVKVDKVPNEFTELNNEMTEYVNVRKDGISILWVEGRRRLEATWILQHTPLANPNSRFSTTYDLRLTDASLTKEQSAYFKTEEKTFDVVVIGDISAARFCGDDPALLDRIAQKVADRRTGLLLLGGYATFGNNDWQTVGKSLAALLPIELNQQWQSKGEDVAVPLGVNKGHRLLQLDAPLNKDLWTDVFQKLEWMRLGKVKSSAVPLLSADGSEIFVVTRDEGPRVAVFGGENTNWAWFSNDDSIRAYERFWTQLVTWLARQEEGNNQVWIKLDKRRIAVGANLKLGLSVGATGKDGQPVPNARFTVKVQGPSGDIFDVSTMKAGEERGAFDKANVVGEYKVMVSATAPGPDGQQIQLGTASARFMGYAEDVENQQPAANHKDLIKLAAAGGGTFRVAGKEELLQCLSEVRALSAGPGWIKRDVWPNWKTPAASEALTDQLGALLQSLALPCLVVFVMCLGMEWFLRRKWGLV